MCFNPSVGILFIQACINAGVGTALGKVSIPRSGFCSFKRGAGRGPAGSAIVSIPRSGFCSFKPLVGPLLPVAQLRFNPSVGILFIQAPLCALQQYCGRCFNPSVGILFIQARTISDSGAGIFAFQSLGRDSVHSS